MAGSSKVTELNFDNNKIRSSEANPFAMFPNLKIISLKNNKITEFPIGKLNKLSIAIDTKLKMFAFYYRFFEKFTTSYQVCGFKQFFERR